MGIPHGSLFRVIHPLLALDVAEEGKQDNLYLQGS